MRVSFVLLFVTVCASTEQLSKSLSIRENVHQNVTRQCEKFNCNVRYNKTNDKIGRWITKENIEPNVIKLWREFPLTVLKNSTLISEQCKIAYDEFLHGIEKYDLNALKMLDATAKPTSGILSGNINQFGDFDECVELQNGKYCLAEIDLTPIWKEPYVSYRNLMHSYFPITETFEDPTHRTPGFSMIRWGFCIPKNCGPNDLEVALKENVGVDVHIRPNMCQTSSKPEDTSYMAYFAKWYFITIIATIILSTAVYEKTQLSKNFVLRLLNCFSLQRNYNSLTTIKENDDEDFEAAHGLRGLCALALLGSHKSMAVLYNPYINRTKMAESISSGWSIIGRNAIIYTETFILLSGLLNANALFRDIQKFNKLNFWDKLINRIFRILPNIITVILFYTYIMPFMGAGPQWPLVVDHHSDLCKKYMWRNLFFIHNLFGFENMCLTHTHQVGIDMQLFIATPLVVYIIWKRKLLGFALLLAICIVSTILRFYVTWTNNLSHVIYFGISISSMFKTANLSYILPTHRATVYFIGVAWAYVFRYSDPKAKVSKIILFFAWTVALPVTVYVWLGASYMSSKTYVYSKMDASIYAAFAPVIWGIGLGALIYYVKRGYAWKLGDLFTWRRYKYFTKISYAFYLVQFPVYFYNVGSRKYVDEYASTMFLQIPEVLTIILWAIALTLSIEMPFQNIKKVLFGNDKTKTDDNTKKDKTN